MFPGEVLKTDLVSLRWREEGSFGALPFYKHFVPTGRSRKSLFKNKKFDPCIAESAVNVRSWSK